MTYQSNLNTSCASLFVGRHQEMAELTAVTDDVLSGKTRIIMLSEAGAGKTRTAQEFSVTATNRCQAYQCITPQFRSAVSEDVYPR